ncbi:MAG: transcription antitermination factor NusB [Chlorobi bacterium]|nr:transcription antitermination factor NusB [Chlorobiota bacterium]
MLNRRVLRIKVLQIVYSQLKKESNSLQQAENELLFSIQKTYDLYWYLLLLLEDLTAYAVKISDIRKNKKFASSEEKNPNLKFTTNRITKIISENETFRKKINEKKLSWSNHPELIKKLYLLLENSEVYRIYLNEKEDNFRNDKRMIKFIFSEVFFNCKDIYTVLEEESIFWINDIDFILTKLTHTIDNIKNHQPESLVFPGKFKQPEDKEFAVNLLRHILIHKNEYSDIIKNNIVNWDIERIADFEKIVLMTAISEIIKFPSIPVNVTFNEYIDLAKLFGSDKSGGFINGILEKVIIYLKKEDLFIKTGRGLI